MKPGSLSLEELAHYAPIDEEVAAYVAENAGRLLDGAIDESAESYSETYDEGYNDGADAKLKTVRLKYLERIQKANTNLNGSEVVNLELSELLHDLIEDLEG